MIPRHPRKVDTAALEARLGAQGVRVHRRTLQRDLEELSSLFPLACDDRERPYGWSWAADAAAFDVPSLSPPAALALRMVSEFLAGALPRSVLHQLHPHLRHAEAVLDHSDRAALGSWPAKVRALHRGQPLAPPEVSPEVFGVVSDSLLEGRRFTAGYTRRGEAAPVTWTVNPLGLVLHDRLLTLVCTIGEHDRLADVRKLLLHRMEGAKPSPEPARRPEGFDLDAYLASGAFGYLRGEASIRLKALFEADAALHLGETPLSADQRLTLRPSGEVLVEASVADTGQLRWWLLGFGGRVEVLEPESLREEMRVQAGRMAGRYGAADDRLCEGGP